jgi:hypothetical protein
VQRASHRANIKEDDERDAIAAAAAAVEIDNPININSNGGRDDDDDDDDDDDETNDDEKRANTNTINNGDDDNDDAIPTVVANSRRSFAPLLLLKGALRSLSVFVVGLEDAPDDGHHHYHGIFDRSLSPFISHSLFSSAPLHHIMAQAVLFVLHVSFFGRCVFVCVWGGIFFFFFFKDSLTIIRLLVLSSISVKAVLSNFSCASDEHLVRSHRHSIARTTHNTQRTQSDLYFMNGLPWLRCSFDNPDYARLALTRRVSSLRAATPFSDSRLFSVSASVRCSAAFGALYCVLFPAWMVALVVGHHRRQLERARANAARGASSPLTSMVGEELGGTEHAMPHAAEPPAWFSMLLKGWSAKHPYAELLWMLRRFLLAGEQRAALAVSRLRCAESRWPRSNAVADGVGGAAPRARRGATVGNAARATAVAGDNNARNNAAKWFRLRRPTDAAFAQLAARSIDHALDALVLWALLITYVFANEVRPSFCARWLLRLFFFLSVRWRVLRSTRRSQATTTGAANWSPPSVVVAGLNAVVGLCLLCAVLWHPLFVHLFKLAQRKRE